jgi:hypothetical protein
MDKRLRDKIKRASALAKDFSALGVQATVDKKTGEIAIDSSTVFRHKNIVLSEGSCCVPGQHKFVSGRTSSGMAYTK